MTLYFNEKYKTGIKELDREHQVLIATLNAIYYSLVDDLETTKNHLNLFLRMMESHFRHEEKILEKSNHPDKGTHAKEHEKLEMELGEIVKTLDSISSTTEFKRIIDRLGTWLVPHILEWDTKINLENHATSSHAPHSSMKREARPDIA